MMHNSFSGQRIYYLFNGKAAYHLDNLNLSHKPSFNHWAIYDFLLYGAILPPQTVWQSVYSLFPGENLDNLNKKNNPAYQKLARVKPLHKSLTYFVDWLDEVLTYYFKNYIKRQPNLALSLSGGLDSAILASYLPVETLAVTWAGWGEKTTDYIYAQKIVKYFGFRRHHVVYPDDEEDLILFKQLIQQADEPFKLTSLAHIKLAQAVRQEFGQQPVSILTGDNADTAAGSFGEVVYSYLFSKLNLLFKFLPWSLIYQNHPFWRKFFLLSTSDPIQLAAFFHSNGIYPGRWIKFDTKNYFQSKQLELRQQLGHHIKHFNDYTLMGMLLTGVVRQVDYPRSLASQRYNLNFEMPYFNEEVMKIFLNLPIYLRARGFFDKLILKRLAQKRRVPDFIIQRPKKGMSYGFKDYLKEKKHLIVWAEMNKNSFLNQFIDIHLVQQQHQNNFMLFDVLRSLHYYIKLNLNLD